MCYQLTMAVHITYRKQENAKLSGSGDEPQKSGAWGCRISRYFSIDYIAGQVNWPGAAV